MTVFVAGKMFFKGTFTETYRGRDQQHRNIVFTKGRLLKGGEK